MEFIENNMKDALGNSFFYQSYNRTATKDKECSVS